jgi:glyoxylase-like metal-dependent hydrolase (beta-lactamase superfamily II)
LNVAELAPGLWRWTAPHPDWKQGDDWEQAVGCVYYEAPRATVLIDPLVPTERERFLEALDRDVERRGLPVSILLTCAWHGRSSGELAERYGAATGGSPDGLVAVGFPVAEETMYWLPEQRTLVTGDSLMGDGLGGLTICPDTWLEGDTPQLLRRDLRSLLDLPVERILVSHGDAVLEDGRAALERALRG